MDKKKLILLLRMEELQEEPQGLQEEPQEEPQKRELDYNWYLCYYRNTRNAYLKQTDKYLLPDYPILPGELEKIKAYRQELRDIININKEAILNGNVNIEIPPIPFI